MSDEFCETCPACRHEAQEREVARNERCGRCWKPLLHDYDFSNVSGVCVRCVEAVPARRGGFGAGRNDVRGTA